MASDVARLPVVIQLAHIFFLHVSQTHINLHVDGEMAKLNTPSVTQHSVRAEVTCCQSTSALQCLITSTLTSIL